MKNNTWMAACGPVAVVLMIAGNELAGATAPGLGAERAELARYLERLEPGWAGLGIEVLGLLALLVFAVHLAELAGGAAGRLVLAGASAAAAVKLGSIAPVAAVWLDPGAVAPEIAGLILDANSAAFVLTGSVSAAVPAGAALSGALPRWLAVFGGVTAFALVAGLAGFREEFALGFLLYLVWTLATGVTLVLSARVRARTPASPGPVAPARPHRA